MHAHKFCATVAVAAAAPVPATVTVTAISMPMAGRLPVQLCANNKQQPEPTGLDMDLKMSIVGCRQQLLVLSTSCLHLRLLGMSHSAHRTQIGRSPNLTRHKCCATAARAVKAGAATGAGRRHWNAVCPVAPSVLAKAVTPLQT